MSTVDDLEHEFLTYAIEQSHPLMAELGGARLSDNLFAVVRRDVDRIASREFAAWYGRGWAFLGLPAARFNNRLLDFGGVRMIAGIRFRNLEPDFPFIAIEQSGIPIGTIAEPAALVAELRTAFSEFRPRALSFHHPSHLPLRVANARGDRHVMIGAARSMVAQPPPFGLDRVRLAASAGLASFERYTALYDRIFEERPWLRGVVRVETRETLKACYQQGLMFDIEVDGEWRGLIAGCEDAIVGVNGIQVVEIVLSRQARGGGLGVAVQRRFAEEVGARDPSAVILGIIDDANLPMRRTAERAGRTDVGASFLVDL
jgi:hypothetical protein